MRGKDFMFVVPMGTTYVVRSETNDAGQDEEWLYIEGERSDTAWDRKRGKVYPEAIRAMVATVNGRRRTPIFPNNKIARRAGTPIKPVGVDVDHSNRWHEQIGEVVEAQVIEKDSGPAMWVRRRIDLGMSAGRDLKRALDKGTQLGWSIYGVVTDYEKDREGREHFKQIDLQKIRVTASPVNPNTRLQQTLSRSMTGVEMETEEQESEAIIGTDLEKAEAEAEAEQEVARAAAPTLDLRAIVEQHRDELLTLLGVARSEETPATAGAAPEAEAPVREEPAREVPAEPEVERADRDVLTQAAAAMQQLAEKPRAAAPEAQAPDLSQYVLRADLESAYILRAEVEGRLAQVREVMRGVPAMVERVRAQATEIGSLQEANTVLRATNEKLVAHVNELTGVVNSILATPMGRLGMHVARSRQEEEAARAAQSGADVRSMPTEQRLQQYREMSRQGQRGKAVGMILGMADHRQGRSGFSHLTSGARKQIENGTPMGG